LDLFGEKLEIWSFLVKNHNGGPLIFEKIWGKKWEPLGKIFPGMVGNQQGSPPPRGNVGWFPGRGDGEPLRVRPPPSGGNLGWFPSFLKKLKFSELKFFEKYLFLSCKFSENYNFYRKNGQFWTFLVKR
jgi:hypothetical protein